MRPLSAIAGILAVMSLAGCTGLKSTPHVIGTVKIGADLPLSGDDAPDGLPVRQAIELAIKQAGSVCGAATHTDACVSVQGLFEDDVSKGIHDPAMGARNIGALAGDTRVVGVIGPLYESLARTEIPVANRAQLAIISPANTDECLTQEPPDGHCHGLAARLRPSRTNTYFRVLTTELAEGQAAADLARKLLERRRAYVVDDKTAFGAAVAAEFARRFTQVGGTVVDAADLTAAKAAGADVVYLGGSDPLAAAALRRQLGTQMPDVPLIGTDRLANRQFTQAAGIQASGSYYIQPGPDPEHLKGAAAFLRDFRRQAGIDATPGAVAAFDATRVLIGAMGRAIDDAGGALPTRSQVLSEVAQTREFNGLMGSMGFDARGDTTLKLVSVYRWVGPVGRSGEYVTGLTI